MQTQDPVMDPPTPKFGANTPSQSRDVAASKRPASASPSPLKLVTPLADYATPLTGAASAATIDMISYTARAPFKKSASEQVDLWSPDAALVDEAKQCGTYARGLLKVHHLVAAQVCGRMLATARFT